MDNMTLKPIQTAQDVAALIPLLQRIWREVFSPLMSAGQLEYMLRTYQGADTILQDIESGTQYFFIVQDGAAIGYTAYALMPEYLFYSKIYLLSSARGKGLSSRLFTHVENVAKSAGKPKIHLHVCRLNKNAVEVYLHRGFQIVNTIDTPIGEGYFLVDYWMEKTL
ncbi:MAG: GNAT family N-acetyltransferase [Clostridiales bacterium]|jgi:GNAT superfamily N-acetyltransferase|nr:GNAT family N-acetyltransferase [Clostridiales bacterium]